MSKIGSNVLKRSTSQDAWHSLWYESQYGIKTKELDRKTTSKLKRIFEGEVHFNPQNWNKKAIDIVNFALKLRKEIANPNDLHIGVPVTPDIGFEHYFNLLSYDGNIPLVVEIPKRDIEKGRFSMSAYRIHLKGGM